MKTKAARIPIKRKYSKFTASIEPECTSTAPNKFQLIPPNVSKGKKAPPGKVVA